MVDIMLQYFLADLNGHLQVVTENHERNICIGGAFFFTNNEYDGFIDMFMIPSSGVIIKIKS
jgi:hypothetical protein